MVWYNPKSFMNISYYTLGCKLNWAETEDLKEQLEKLGHATVPFLTTEKIAIIRACGVTMDASKSTRETIRRAKKMGKIIIALGCIENSDLPEIDFVSPTNESAIEYIMNLAESEPATQTKTPAAPLNRTRAFLKIQTGCNFSCAYCIIPRFRGRTQSVPAKNIIEKIKELEKKKYKEATLTGVNICLYQDGKTDLAGLLKKILKETKIQRIRLGSLDPRLISSDFIKLYPNDRLMPHWHLSLQSGADNVLKLMRRGYTTKQYGEIVKKIRARVPTFSFTTDIIIGFPGETETDFAETKKFVEEVQFAKVHVFPFSPRPETVAAKMKKTVRDSIKKNRVKELITWSDKIGKKFAVNFFNQTKPILFEHRRGKNWEGYTPEYLRVVIRSENDLYNKIMKIKLNKENLK